MTTTAAVAPADTLRFEAASPIRRPPTERVLDKLAGPRLAWTLAWGLLPFAAYEVAYAASPWPSYPGMASNLIFGLVNLLGLWAVARLSGRVTQLQLGLARLLPAAELVPMRHPFRHVGSLLGPLAISALMALTWEAVDFVSYPSPATGLLVVVVFVGQLGVATFLWVYGASLFGLDQVGRRELRLEPFATDPGLGLRSLGSLGFEAFLLAGAMSLPILVVASSDPRGFVSSLITLAFVSGLFFLSAYHLHRRLAEAKAGHVRWARQLVEVAMEPLQESSGEAVDPTTVGAALDRATPRLAAAVEIERRALAIHEWPFDAAILRTVAAVLTSVTAAILARLLLGRLGI